MTRRKKTPEPHVPETVARFCLIREQDKLVLELVQDFSGGCTRERYRQIVNKMRRQYKQMQIMRAALEDIVGTPGVLKSWAYEVASEALSKLSDGVVSPDAIQKKSYSDKD